MTKKDIEKLLKQTEFDKSDYWQRLRGIRQKTYLRDKTPARFIEAFIKDEQGLPVTLSDHQWLWHNFITEARSRGFERIGIIAPYRHGKSVNFAIGYTLYRILNNPNLRVKIVCQDEDTAKKRVSALKNYIEFDPDIISQFPDARPNNKNKWTMTSFELQRENVGLIDPTVEAFGINSMSSGSSADLLMLDDIVDAKNSLTEKKRDTVTDMVLNVALQRMEPGGLALSISTAWHLLDAIHKLADNTEWVFLVQAVRKFSYIENIIVSGGQVLSGWEVQVG